MVKLAAEVDVADFLDLFDLRFARHIRAAGDTFGSIGFNGGSVEDVYQCYTARAFSFERDGYYVSHTAAASCYAPRAELRGTHTKDRV